MTEKRFTLGTHRAVSPEETLGRVGESVDLFGITRVADITGLDRVGIPVMAAYRPDSWSLAVSMGKGVTAAAARASALMECIELWHAERTTLSLVWGSVEELEDAHHVVDWSRLSSAPNRAFSGDTATAWVEAVSLVHGSRALVPYETVHTDGRFPEPPGSGWFACTSNGLASGNNVVEAKVHALCEIIERDAVTFWQLAGGPPVTAIDPGTVEDNLSRDLLDRLAAAGLAVLLHDLTSDVGVATVQCTLFERDPDPNLIVYATTGAGCHPAPTVALLRAVTEAAQSRLTLISGARDDVFRPTYARPPDAAARSEHLRSQCAAARHRSFAELPDLATDSLEGDLDAVVAALVARDLHPYWVDLRQVDLDIPVGRAIVPGLEHLTGIDGYRPGKRARAALGGDVT